MFDGTVLSSAFQFLLKRAFSRIQASLTEVVTDGTDTERALPVHIAECEAWSRSINALGLSPRHKTDEDTVALRIGRGHPTDIDRLSEGDLLHELDLINGPENYLILGGPGSGKTTTLKRLARHLLTREPSGPDEQVEFPLVLRLREMQPGETIFTLLANALGVPYRTKRIEMKGPGGPVADYQLFVGRLRLETFLPDLLDTLQPLLLVDGLDEVRERQRSVCEADLVKLALRTRRTKVVLSCRTGDVARVLEGFEVVTLCGLTEEQQLALSNHWLEDPSLFISQLRSFPYHDVGDRPLLLIQLLYIHSRYGYLPEQASEIYELLVDLLLKEWDAERGIQRPSRYASFSPQRKAKFLSALSYHLTYKIKTQSFGRHELMEAYERLCEQFELPKEEGSEVAAELETHTGLVVAAGHNRYEFSHLSLQEYLAAQHLVREPAGSQLARYLAEYPAPVAVGVALSSSPSIWFATIMLRRSSYRAFDEKTLVSFLARIETERPAFEVAAPMGIALGKLFQEFVGHPSVKSYLRQLLRSGAVLGSVIRGLDWYFLPAVPTHEHDCIYLVRRFGLLNSFGIKAPGQIAFPRDLLETVIEESPGALLREEAPGRLAVVRERAELWA